MANIFFTFLGFLLFVTVLILVFWFFAYNRQVQSQRQLRVQASASEEVKPDWVIVRVAVVVENKSAQQAMTEANVQMSKVLQAIKTVTSPTIPDEDIRTSEYSLVPSYRPITDASPSAGSTIVGYTATQEATILLRNLTTPSATGTATGTAAGILLDNVLKAGANNIRNLSFEISPAKQETVLKRLRKEAIERAQTIAEQEAEVAGVKLGKILTISEPTIDGPIPLARTYSLGEVSNTGAKISPGTQTMTFTVSITYTIH